ncbi:ChtBD2 [Urbanus proteus nucleopolyhedrovirus]|uniref:ChtBD2 n=1 Tax=Urbanus proteus nucleopolyhedrovirus TaxID=1675866 RepID=A0A161CCX1_9ABAC|nr:ChtBD2 [Urbanus proteus nucleopolyhedrovirus]AKR17281.1 ChtBD2 [Urbanus proteus nucleopolyhedrovirus]
MWFLLIFFILLKILVFCKMTNLQKNLHADKMCPKGYHGLVPDPYDCAEYIQCPAQNKFFCPNQYQFDLEQQKCVPIDLKNGCIAQKYNNLLL